MISAAATAPSPAKAGDTVFIGKAAPVDCVRLPEAPEGVPEAISPLLVPVLVAEALRDRGVPAAEALNFSVPAVMMRLKLLIMYCDSPLNVIVWSKVCASESVQ